MDLPLQRLRFRFGRLGSTRTCVVFFAMNLFARGGVAFNDYWSSLSLDHLFGPHEHKRGNREVKSLGGLEINHQLKLRRLFRLVGQRALCLSVFCPHSMQRACNCQHHRLNKISDRRPLSRYFLDTSKVVGSLLLGRQFASVEERGWSS
jgi:hypothetical protein